MLSMGAPHPYVDIGDGADACELYRSCRCSASTSSRRGNTLRCKRALVQQCVAPLQRLRWAFRHLDVERVFSTICRRHVAFVTGGLMTLINFNFPFNPSFPTIGMCPSGEFGGAHASVLHCACMVGTVTLET